MHHYRKESKDVYRVAEEKLFSSCASLAVSKVNSQMEVSKL
jgi:hypothetical protein